MPSRNETIERLNNLNVHEKFYGIDGEIKEGAYNLVRRSDGKYETYFLERGEKNGLRVFETENEAYTDLLKSIEVNIRYGLDLSK